MLLIPRMPVGVPNHALCVVDDLVFDPIKDRALRLCNETFLHIFNDKQITIHRALLFNQNLTSEPNKEMYTRPLTLHPTTPSTI